MDDDGKKLLVLKIKLKNKIIADGINDTTFNYGKQGKICEYSANEWIDEKMNQRWW